MPVEIIVNWNFLGDGEEAHVTYGAPAHGVPPEEPEHDESEQALIESVVPLGSSVLAPGLSMPIPAR